MPGVRKYAAKRFLLSLALILTTACGSSARFVAPQLGEMPAGVKAVCGSSDILGQPVPTIQQGACGIAEPVQLFAVSGVKLSAAPTLNCPTARALNKWVRNEAGPSIAATGEQLAKLRVVASYACRNRNHQAGARLSEHAKGNAIDIAEIGFASGDSLSVFDDWDNGRDGRLLRSLHKGACGIFGTVLGPEADRFHEDHFHFDTAKHGKPYCR